MVLNFLKITVYVKTPALRDILAEKHLTKILKCFTISAALCISVFRTDPGTPYGASHPGQRKSSQAYGVFLSLVFGASIILARWAR
jgi:hypothetical protein